MNYIGNRIALLASLSLAAVLLTSCGSGKSDKSVIISVKDQQMLLLDKGEPVTSYAISTSKYGLGSQPGSMRTPLGKMEVVRKIGRGAPAGAVFKSRQRTGEILQPNAPGRDPIVTRILWLHGKQRHNRNSFARYIYIHGTPEERNIGHPASYGCIRMKSSDIIDLYNRVGIGSSVDIIRKSLNRTRPGKVYASRHKQAAATVSS